MTILIDGNISADFFGNSFAHICWCWQIVWLSLQVFKTHSSFGFNSHFFTRITTSQFESVLLWGFNQFLNMSFCWLLIFVACLTVVVSFEIGFESIWWAFVILLDSSFDLFTFCGSISEECVVLVELVKTGSSTLSVPIARNFRRAILKPRILERLVRRNMT